MEPTRDIGVGKMAQLTMRDMPTGWIQVSITTIAAIGAGTGVLFLGSVIFLVVLIVRDRREHNRLMADLEERGIAIAQTQKDAKHESITRPRAVLVRNPGLPFNAKSGWGNLPSVETINPPEPPPLPAHYAPPKPPGFVPKSKRLSWPFLNRQASGRAIPMKKMRVNVLSTVIESPKPSPLVPVLSGPLGGESSSPMKTLSRPSSDQSLLQHHPAFSNQEQGSESTDQKNQQEIQRSLTVKPSPKMESQTYTRPNRSQSLAENTKPGNKTRFPRPKLHERSVSTSSQASSNPPEGGLPILPLEIARIKREARRRSLLSRSPSRQSISSCGSGDSSILATQSSPIMPSSNTCVQKVPKKDFRNSMIVVPRPFRDTLTLHGKNKTSQGSIKSSAARFSSVTPAAQAESPADKRSSLLTNSSSANLLAQMKVAESVTLSKVSSPAGSPFVVRSLTTPKRRSGSYVTPYGSPEDRRKRSSILQNVSGNSSDPKRQLSEASTHASSTRSSNGNPFQWDPAPMSAGKPSALKGSPSARKPGHKRQNCVRISLVPTYLGSRSRSPSPAILDIVEESPDANSEKAQHIGPALTSTRSLPRPPSTSIFAPDLKITTTNIRTSLTASSPTLSMANFDHGPIGTPVKTKDKSSLPNASQQEKHRMSTESIFSILSFLSPCHNVPETSVMVSPPPIFALSRPSNEFRDETMLYNETAIISSPYELLLDINSSPGRPLLLDEYDPERPYLVHQTTTGNPMRSFSSPFSTIHEEPTAQTNRPGDLEQLKSDDSSPCSPKTVPSPLRPDLHDRTAYNLPVKETAIPEEPLDTIDPAILSKDAFTSLNSPFDNKTGSIVRESPTTLLKNSLPTDSTSAVYSMQPLLDAAFPSSPSLQHVNLATPHDSTTALEPPPFCHSSPSSLYSSPSPTLPPSPPCSAHATLPAPAAPTLNFTTMPTLAPCGPRGAPPRSLRSSIQTLRRMNSDAKTGGREERRYCNFGRESSIALPGEESWLEDLDGYNDSESLDEEKGRRLFGDLPLLEGWEEGVTVLDIGSDTTIKEEIEKQARRDRSSSVWEDGENFWQSTPPPPHPPTSSTSKHSPRFSSPAPTASPWSSCKRAFDVAKDVPPAQQDAHSATAGKSKRDNARYRRRSVAPLGPSTPNVRIMVSPPSGGRGGGVGEGTPGSLYDAEGFYVEEGDVGGRGREGEWCLGSL